MKNKYIKILENQTENNLASLKEAVLWALELFILEWKKEIKLKNFKRRVVVGSGNAIVTWKVIFQWTDVIFADENNYKQAIKMPNVDWVTILSASGWKHSSIIAKDVLEIWLETELITCTKNSKTEKIIKTPPLSETPLEKGRKNKKNYNIVITPKNPEPYTYNTSTYMWWILAFTKENPEEIYDFLINDLEKQLKDFDFSKYNSFLFALDSQFSNVWNLIDTKFIELFWRKVARDIKTFEQLKHAVTVVSSETELLIKFSEKEVFFENDILELKIPENIDKAWMMAIWYYIVWFIQNSREQFFKKNIKNYIDNLAKTEFWKGLSVIV